MFSQFFGWELSFVWQEKTTENVCSTALQWYNFTLPVSEFQTEGFFQASKSILGHLPCVSVWVIPQALVFEAGTWPWPASWFCVFCWERCFLITAYGEVCMYTTDMHRNTHSALVNANLSFFVCLSVLCVTFSAVTHSAEQLSCSHLSHGHIWSRELWNYFWKAEWTNIVGMGLDLPIVRILF